MPKEIIDIRPFILKIGVAVALSFAGFLYGRLIDRKSCSSTSPRSSGPSDQDRNGIGERRTSATDDSKPPKRDVESPGDSTLILDESSGRCTLNNNVSNGIQDEGDMQNVGEEIARLKCLVQMLQERERILELELLELYGLREQETTLLEMQNRLKINNMESKFLSLKIESLQEDNYRLHTQVADYHKLVAELENSREKIKSLKQKLHDEAKRNKEHIFALQRRVSLLVEQEQLTKSSSSGIKVDVERMNKLEVEADELRSSNFKLQSENAELARQLDSAQILASSILEDSETETLREQSAQLRKENEELVKTAEQLQAARCADAEELVYLKWVNACLRYELRNFQPPHGKTAARDLSKTLSPNSEEKVKQLILDYATTEDAESYHWPSSGASYSTDSGELDDSFLSTKTSNSGKRKFFSKLRTLVNGGRDTSSLENAPSLCGAEDIDSPRGSLSVSSTTDSTCDPNRRSDTPSLNLSRHSSRSSSDAQRSKETKPRDPPHRSSDADAPCWWRKSSPDGDSESDPCTLEKAELVKFALVLKDGDARRQH